ncbi:MAG TPA: permease prefix domain 1-containing protein [Candidatus Brocadiia bacterium]|nr:permease prefix domain 1-containing protein [Candidatus Brocadiia bacterium]
MRELKKQVERVVRPIRAVGHRKDRMREELLAHLTATYDEELERDGDEPAAVARALQRFGDPSDLRLELQASVPLLERVLCVRFPCLEWYVAIERRACKWNPEDSGLRYASRVTGAAIVFWIGWALLGIASTLPIALFRPAPAGPIVIWGAHFLGAFIGSLLVGCFLGSLCIDRFRRAILPRPLQTKDALRAAGWCALAVPVAVVVAILFRALAPGWLPSMGHRLNVDLIECFLPLFWPFVAASPFFFAIVGAFGLAEQKRYEEWGSLVLDE